MAWALLELFDLTGKLILTDKGYDSDKFVRWVEERGGIIVIRRITAKHPRNVDWSTYKERHLLERFFLLLKNNRRFATRYEKKSLVSPFDQILKYDSSAQAAAFTQKCVKVIVHNE